MCVAAAMLYQADKQSQYKTDAEAYFDQLDSSDIPEHFDWDDKRVACGVSPFNTLNDSKSL